jgi:hypothetical protein
LDLQALKEVEKLFTPKLWNILELNRNSTTTFFLADRDSAFIRRKFGSRAFAEKLREPDGNPLVWVQQTIL